MSFCAVCGYFTRNNLRHDFDNARHWPISRRGFAIGIAQVNAAVVPESSDFGKRPAYRLSGSEIAGIERGFEIGTPIRSTRSDAFQLMRSTCDGPGNCSSDLDRRYRRTTYIILPLEIRPFHGRGSWRC